MDASINGGKPTPERTAWLIQRLWFAGTAAQSPTVYAVVDCARDVRILPLIQASGCHYKCALSQPLQQTVLHKAPHIVRLDANRPFTRTLLSLGWGARWGFFCVVPKPAVIEMVRQSIGPFLFLNRHDGERQWFNFCDPAVLRGFLPERDWFTARKFFGPASEILCEGADPLSVECFRLTDMGVSRVRHPVSLRTPDKEPKPAIPFFDPQEFLV